MSDTQPTSMASRRRLQRLHCYDGSRYDVGLNVAAVSREPDQESQSDLTEKSFTQTTNKTYLRAGPKFAFTPKPKSRFIFDHQDFLTSSLD